MLADEFDGIWFCQDCGMTFVFEKDAIYHCSKTGHKTQKDD
jgi:hypothetical protein